MAAGIEEFDRGLAAGAATALIDDPGAVLVEAIAGAEHLVEGGELESQIRRPLRSTVPRA